MKVCMTGPHALIHSARGSSLLKSSSSFFPSFLRSKTLDIKQSPNTKICVWDWLECHQTWSKLNWFLHLVCNSNYAQGPFTHNYPDWREKNCLIMITVLCVNKIIFVTGILIMITTNLTTCANFNWKKKRSSLCTLSLPLAYGGDILKSNFCPMCERPQGFFFLNCDCNLNFVCVWIHT